MWLAYAIALSCVAALCVLSVNASRRFRDIQQFPMQWDLKGRPTWTTPRWVALGFTPVIALAVVTAVVVIRHRQGNNAGAVQDAAVVSVIMLLAHVFYLHLLRKQLSRGAS